MKYKEINFIGKISYKTLFDNSIKCGELSQHGCNQFNWDVENKEDDIFTLKCNNCKQTIKIKILNYNKCIEDAT